MLVCFAASEFHADSERDKGSEDSHKALHGLINIVTSPFETLIPVEWFMQEEPPLLPTQMRKGHIRGVKSLDKHPKVSRGVWSCKSHLSGTIQRIRTVLGLERIS